MRDERVGGVVVSVCLLTLAGGAASAGDGWTATTSNRAPAPAERPTPPEPVEPVEPKPAAAPAAARGGELPCSDGSGFGVDVDEGLLPVPSFAIVNGDTSSLGAGICGYSFFGTPIGEPAPGPEFVSSFTVAAPASPRVFFFGGATTHDVYVADGTFVLGGEAIPGSPFVGDVLDDTVGWTPVSGAVRDSNGSRIELSPGVTYYVIGDNDVGLPGLFDIDLILDAICSDGSGFDLDDPGSPLVFGPGTFIVDGTTAGAGNGVCAYAFVDDFVGPEAIGPETIYAFEVTQPVKAEIEFFSGDTDHDIWLADATPTDPVRQLPSAPSAVGAVAVRTIGYAATDGPLLNSNGSQRTLRPEDGPFYLIADSPTNVPGFWDIDLILTAVTPVECPPGARLEGETTCPDDDDDRFNGGCNSTVEAFSPLELGDTVCGQGGFYVDASLGLFRDTDWFEIVVDEPTNVIMRGNADFDATFGLIEQTTPGAPGCAGVTGLFAARADIRANEPGSVAFTLPAGTSYIFFAASFGADENTDPCGLDYTFTIEEACAEDVTGDGFIDVLDLNRVLAVFNQPASADPLADISGDGFIDVLDLNALLGLFNEPCL